MKKTAPFFVLLASVLWGSMGIVTRYIADIGFHTRQITAVRICVSTIVLAIFLLLTDRKKLKIEKKIFNGSWEQGSEVCLSITWHMQRLYRGHLFL